jgi:hypothetical protein
VPQFQQNFPVLYVIPPATKIFSLFSLFKKGESQMTSNSIHYAVEIVKAAIPSQPGTWINHPEQVAKFIEVVATKIDTLSQSKTT